VEDVRLLIYFSGTAKTVW
jgi:hypothetical protein